MRWLNDPPTHTHTHIPANALAQPLTVCLGVPRWLQATLAECGRGCAAHCLLPHVLRRCRLRAHHGSHSLPWCRQQGGCRPRHAPVRWHSSNKPVVSQNIISPPLFKMALKPGFGCVLLPAPIVAGGPNHHTSRIQNIKKEPTFHTHNWFLRSRWFCVAPGWWCGRLHTLVLRRHHMRARVRRCRHAVCTPPLQACWRHLLLQIVFVKGVACASLVVFTVYSELCA